MKKKLKVNDVVVFEYGNVFYVGNVIMIDYLNWYRVIFKKEGWMMYMPVHISGLTKIGTL